MAMPQYQQVQKAFEKGGLSSAFLEVLNWDSKPNDTETFLVDGQTYTGHKVASFLQGIVVFEFDFTKAPEVSPSQQKQISKAVGTRYVERLVIFKTKSKSVWLWPKKTAGGTLSYEKLEAPSDTLPTYLAQRLAALSISNSEIENGPTVPLIREKLRGSFDTSTVTKKFYEKFRDEHKTLAAAITGLEEEQKHSYATLILNRLMFIYFLQKKEFLNQDPNYLRSCLNSVRKLQGEGKFFSFYKDLLLELFFEGLNKKNGNFQPEEISKIIGKVPYINGGIFGESELEAGNEISIPDEVFEGIFNFFDSFTWHLDTRPTGKSDEINPEVIGYIFEQYINFTAGGKKENGAYYTKQDVTGYMVGQTLVPRILDFFVEAGLSPMQLLIQSGTRYINNSMLHGWQAIDATWIDIDVSLETAWRGDPIYWGALDETPHNAEVSLPGETWVETFHRRERVEKLIKRVAAGEISTVNDLITNNLNSQLLLLDCIDALDNPQDFDTLWSKIEAMSVIDPTCGSGAFLFAALEVLEDVYSHLVDVAEELSNYSELAKQITFNQSAHKSRRYFIRKQAALNNIYGTDLMPDAVETAKLRIFLALASCLESANEIEPLPDLDFNLKPGNLVVGFKDEDDTLRVAGNQIIGMAEIQKLGPKIEEYQLAYSSFVADSKEGRSNPQSKTALLNLSRELRREADRIYAECVGLPDDNVAKWAAESKPLHWFVEFPQVINAGGFDVIIGNPPYVKAKELNKTELIGYKTLNTPDLYAICYERSLSLLSKQGRHAFVVMLNLAFSDQYGSLRKIFAESGLAEWWSTFGKRPDGLFSGVQVVNTIAVLGPNRKVHVTKHNVFSKESRNSLFENLEYGLINRSDSEVPHRSGLAAELAEAIRSKKSNYPLNRDGKVIHFRPTARYWFPVLPGPIPLLDPAGSIVEDIDPGLKTIKLFEGENSNISAAILAGKLGYLFWSSSGDDFHASSNEALHPRALGMSLAASEKLHALAEKVIQAAKNALFSTVNAGSQQVNIRWNSIRDITDEFDRQLLTEAGLNGEWRSLNIWYRQTMKSTGENANGRNYSKSDIERLALTW